jgi:hypothetical protein
VHLFRHFFARMRGGTLQNFRIVVIEPFQPSIAIEWLNVRARPTAQVAIAVSVNFELFCALPHRFSNIISQFAFDVCARINYRSIRGHILLFVAFEAGNVCHRNSISERIHSLL